MAHENPTIIHPMTIKGIIKKAEFKKIEELKKTIEKEMGSFPCCGELPKKYIDAFWELLWHEDETRKQLAEKEKIHGKVEWYFKDGLRVFYL